MGPDFSLLQMPDFAGNALRMNEAGQQNRYMRQEQERIQRERQRKEQMELRRKEIAGGYATDPVAARQQAVGEGDFDLAAEFDKLGDAEREQLKRETEEGVKALVPLLDLPQEQRATFLQQKGVPPEAIGQIDLSDAGLNAEIYKAMSLSDIFKERDRVRDDQARKQRDEEMRMYREGSLDIRRGQLGLSQQREGRQAAKAAGGGRSGGGSRAAPKPPAGFILD